MKIILIMLVILAGCSQLPKGEKCTMTEKHSATTSFSFTGGVVTPTISPGRARYECTDGKVYWVNE